MKSGEQVLRQGRCCNCRLMVSGLWAVGVGEEKRKSVWVAVDNVAGTPAMVPTVEEGGRIARRSEEAVRGTSGRVEVGSSASLARVVGDRPESLEEVGTLPHVSLFAR